jgi:hypothetical protein
MVKNKRGWITILEATIAVMLVSGVLVVVYIQQGSDDSSFEDYIFSLQKQILSDVSMRSDLRTLVLEENETALNVFVDSKVPSAYRHSIKVCRLESLSNFCKLNSTEVVETQGKDIFAEEIVVSSELNSTDPSKSQYNATKVRLFIWENR